MGHGFFLLLVIVSVALIITQQNAWGLLGLIIIIGSWLVFIYNNLVQLSQQVNESWSDILVQLKRRSDLIPNLISTVKGYATHEEGVFERVTQARSQMLGAKTVGETAQADNMLTGALKSLFAVAEAYPDLKANQNFLELQRELTDTEDKIQASRRFYNATVREYTIFRQSFPTNLLIGLFKQFELKEYFELESDKESAVPQVKF